ncbi:hypothetical protein PYCC9005_002095 [Savitreella phatthalungensis]
MPVKQESVEPLTSVTTRRTTWRDDPETDLDLSGASNKLWLVKLPKFLYDRWIEAEPGAEVGALRINEANRREMRVVLPDDMVEGIAEVPAPPPPPPIEASEVDDQKQSPEEDSATEEEGLPPPPAVRPREPIPQEYSLIMQNQMVTNTYVFSEPPAVASKAPGAVGDDILLRHHDAEDSDEDAPKGGAAPGFAGADYGPDGKRRAGGPDRTRRNQGGQRMRGKVVHECLVKPVDDERYRSLLRLRNSIGDKPRRQIRQIDDMTGNLLQPGQIAPAQGSVNKFMAGVSVSGKVRQKGREIHARLPIDALMDMIFKCFEEYEFWSLKAFKHQLKQPESYLKEVLEGIAVLHKRGPNTGKWQLKQETKGAIKGLMTFKQQERVTANGQAAPDDNISSGEDEDVEMEDRL